METTAANKNVVIADDHAVVRAGLARVIELQPGLRVVAQAHDGEECWQQVIAHHPDVVVLDISMPSVDGFEVLSRAARAEMGCRFILLTQHESTDYWQKAQALGAMGYVHKAAALAEIVQAIESVLHGDTYVSRAGDPQAPRDEGKGPWLSNELQHTLAKLTATEKTVLKYLAQNLTSREIASSLHVSYRTVQNHRANICNKLRMRGNNRLLQFALEYRDQISEL